MRSLAVRRFDRNGSCPAGRGDRTARHPRSARLRRMQPRPELEEGVVLINFTRAHLFLDVGPPHLHVFGLPVGEIDRQLPLSVPPFKNVLIPCTLAVKRLSPILNTVCVALEPKAGS